MNEDILKQYCTPSHRNGLSPEKRASQNEREKVNSTQS